MQDPQNEGVVYTKGSWIFGMLEHLMGVTVSTKHWLISRGARSSAPLASRTFEECYG